MTNGKPLLTGLATLAAAGLVAVAFGWSAVAAASPTLRATGGTNGPVLANHPFTLTIYPSGARREHVLDANFAVQPGVPVTITVINYTQRMHTITTPGVGSSFLIHAGSRHTPSRTTFSFVANNYGVFRWHCALPCGRDMSGYVYAIIGE